MRRCAMQGWVEMTCSLPGCSSALVLISMPPTSVFVGESRNTQKSGRSSLAEISVMMNWMPGSRIYVTRPGRPLRRTGWWGLLAVSLPAGSPKSSKSAGRALPFPVRRIPDCGRSKSVSEHSRKVLSTERLSVPPTWRGTCVQFLVSMIRNRFHLKGLPDLSIGMLTAQWSVKVRRLWCSNDWMTLSRMVIIFMPLSGGLVRRPVAGSRPANLINMPICNQSGRPLKKQRPSRKRSATWKPMAAVCWSKMRWKLKL